jgi:hypothetical protein
MANPGQNERPEALATFAEAARSGGKKPDHLGLEADDHTTPIPTDPNAEHDAAAKVLHKGATGRETGADQAVDRLPDRIVESRRSDGAWRGVVTKVMLGAAGLFLLARLLSGFRVSADDRYRRAGRWRSSRH